MDYNNYPNPYNYHDTQALVSKTSAVMKQVYLKMTAALAVTGGVALWCANSMSYLHFVATNSWFQWVLIIGIFGMVFAINGALRKLSSGAATLLFYVFAVLFGLWTAPIFVIYTGASIAKTFFITAGTFAAMSVYGYTTNKDLTKFGNILFMALIGLIIASLVNIFLRSDGLQWIISIFGVLIFVGLTAWDTQTIKKMAMMMPNEHVSRLATIGAMSLYMDFINLFLYLLQFFGRGND